MLQLEVKQVHKVYPSGTDALSGVSFTLEQGSFLSVIGPSGAGKTTLFRILNGMERCTEGEILYAGQHFERAKGKAKRQMQKQIGTVYQDFCLVEQMSCLQNVLNAALPEMNPVAGALGLFSAAQKDEAAALLEQVGLADKVTAKVRELSGGQKQRVSIARALMQHPAILLADEPVASLDPVTGRQIVELLKSIQQERGLTVLMNSHNLEFAREYSDELLGLHGGKVVFSGAVDRLDDTALTDIYGSIRETEVCR